MSNLDLKINQKYHVKGYKKPVTLVSFRSSTGLATIENEGQKDTILIKDILGPVIDSLLAILGRWLKSLFK